MDEIDLYVDGADFYLGSTAKDLKNGWCNFQKLGRTLAHRHFGTSSEVGRIYYLNSPIVPSTRSSFEEELRKEFWMGALHQEVEPLVVSRSANTELALRRPEDAPCALIIAAGPNQHSPTEEALSARYRDYVALAVPPDCELSRSGPERFSHSELEAARLENSVYAPDTVYRWGAYERSKNDSRVLTEYYKGVQGRLLGFFENELKKCSPSSPLPLEVLSRLRDRVEEELRGSGLDSRLERSTSCRDFLTDKMIASATSLLTGSGVTDEVPTATTSPERAGQPQCRVKIADTFQTAIERLAGKDQRLRELCHRRISDFRINPKQRGFSLERVQGSKDPDLWSFRVSKEIRIILRQGAHGTVTLCYVGHHDEAYQWAERK